MWRRRAPCPRQQIASALSKQGGTWGCAGGDLVSGSARRWMAIIQRLRSLLLSIENNLPKTKRVVCSACRFYELNLDYARSADSILLLAYV